MKTHSFSPPQTHIHTLACAEWIKKRTLLTSFGVPFSFTRRPEESVYLVSVLVRVNGYVKICIAKERGVCGGTLERSILYDLRKEPLLLYRLSLSTPSRQKKKKPWGGHHSRLSVLLLSNPFHLRLRAKYVSPWSVHMGQGALSHSALWAVCRVPTACVLLSIWCMCVVYRIIEARGDNVFSAAIIQGHTSTTIHWKSDNTFCAYLLCVRNKLKSP